MTDSPPIILGSSRIWDAPQLALSNVVAGNLKAAGLAYTAPQSLTPEERRKLSDRFGLTDSPLAHVVDITTHPLVVAGAALTLTFPKPTIEDMMDFKRTSSRLVQKMNPALDWIAPLRDTFRGTDLPGLVEAASRRKIGWQAPLYDKLVKSVTKASSAYNGKLPTVASKQMGALNDGLYTKDAGTWKAIKGLIEKYGRPSKDREFSLSNGSAIPDSNIDLELQERVKALLNSDTPLGDHGLPAAAQEAVKDVAREISPVKYRDVVAPMAGSPKAYLIYGRRAGVGTEAARLVGNIVPELPDHFPHMRLLSPEEQMQVVEAYSKLEDPTVKVSEKSFKQAKAANRPNAFLNTEKSESMRNVDRTTRVSSGREVERTGAMLPKWQDLQEIGAHPDLVEFTKRYEKLTGIQGYSLDFAEVHRRDLEQSARVFAHSVVPEGADAAIGDRIAKEVGDLNLYNPSKARYFQDVVVPAMLGGKSPSQVTSALKFANTKTKLVEFFDGEKAAKFIPNNLRTFLRDTIANDPSLSYPAVGEAISSFFYHSTLGLNSVASALNLLQPIVTLPGKVGRYMLNGYAETFKNLPEFYKLRLTGLSTEEAMQKVFPDFVEHHQELNPVARSELQNQLESSFQKVRLIPSVVEGKIDKIKQGMMFMFSNSEMSNRLVAWYSGKARAYAEAPGLNWTDYLTGKKFVVPKSGPLLEKAARDFGGYTVGSTQYGNSLLERPMGISEWWAPLRQFLTFPLRQLNYVVSDLAHSPGAMGRALLVSGLAYAGAREFFKQDIGRGLLFGGLPGPTEGQPFAPLPIVPPAFQLLGSAGLSVATGDSKPLRQSIPLLLPGGIQAARLLGSAGALPGVGGVAGAVSSFIGRSYADYNNRLPDGRIPVYSADGGLQAYYSPAQLVGKAIGLQSVEQQQEAEFNKFLLGNRDRIQGMRRDIATALQEGDAQKAQDLIAEYNRVFPRMGDTPLQASDIKAMQAHNTVSRLERLLDTLPQDVRSQYVAAVSIALGGQASNLFGLSPGGFESASSSKARAGRQFPSAMRNSSQNLTPDLTPSPNRANLRESGIAQSRAARDRVMNGPQSGFGTFGTY